MQEKTGEQELSILSLIKTWGVVGVVGVIGAGILLYGVWRVVAPEKPKVEIVGEGQGSELIGSSEPMRSEIVVDVAGAVEKQGLYKLPSGSRVGDALVMAGGLAAQADREWVSKYINLAEEAKDGGKIYIPRQSESSDNQNAQGVGDSDGEVAGVTNKININTASASELDSLWGVGEARAKTIIENRPYGSVEELLTKAKIPQNVYDSIKAQVTVY